MTVCLLRIDEALPTKLTPQKPSRGNIRFIYRDDKLLEVILCIYPLKHSVQARKAGKKIPIGISANADPFLMTAELLWLLVAVDPTADNPSQTPMFKKASSLAVMKSRSNLRGDATLPSRHKKHAFARRTFFPGGGLLRNANGRRRVFVPGLDEALQRRRRRRRSAAAALFAGRSRRRECIIQKKNHANTTTTRTAARQPRPAAAAIPQPPLRPS